LRIQLILKGRPAVPQIYFPGGHLYPTGENTIPRRNSSTNWEPGLVLFCGFPLNPTDKRQITCFRTAQATKEPPYALAVESMKGWNNSTPRGRVATGCPSILGLSPGMDRSAAFSPQFCLALSNNSRRGPNFAVVIFL
jgi:hypothetical protein